MGWLATCLTGAFMCLDPPLGLIEINFCRLRGSVTPESSPLFGGRWVGYGVKSPPSLGGI